MTGTFDQERRRVSTSAPSRSGRREIEDHQVERAQGRAAQALGGVRGLVDGEAVELEAGAQETPDLRLVVDDEHDGGLLSHGLRHSGRACAPESATRRISVEPRSTPSLFASRLPPLACRNALAIHRPRPEPEVAAAGAIAAEEALAERGRAPRAVSPAPLSATVTASHAVLDRAAMRIGEPVGEYFIAFSITWPSACSTRFWST